MSKAILELQKKYPYLNLLDDNCRNYLKGNKQAETVQDLDASVRTMIEIYNWCDTRLYETSTVIN